MAVEVGRRRRHLHKLEMLGNTDAMLVYGGTLSSTGATTSNSWMYNTTANTWTDTTAIFTQTVTLFARQDHEALWIEQDQCMLVYGKDNPADIAPVQCLDPFVDKAWSEWWPSGVVVPDVRGHTLVFNTEHKCALLFGGWKDSSATNLYGTLWCYTLTGSTTTSTTTTATATVVTSTSTTTTATFTTTQQVENTWFHLEPIGRGPVGREMFSIVLRESDGVVLVFGGSVFVWDPVTGTQNTTYYDDLWMYSTQGNFWSTKTSRPMPSSGHSAVLSPDGHCMLVYGGQVAEENLSQTLWCYNMTADTWQDTGAANSPAARLGHTAVMANDNCMYVFAGYLSRGNYTGPGTEVVLANDWQCYNVQTNAWTEITPTGDVPLEPRYFHTAVLVQDCIYIFGGYNASYGILSELGCFNITRRDYTLLEDPGTARTSHGAAWAPSFDCMIVWGGLGAPSAYGGFMAVNDGSTVQSYNYKEGVWERRDVTSQSPYPRAGVRAVYVPQWDAQLFFGGGACSGSQCEGMKLTSGFSCPGQLGLKCLQQEARGAFSQTLSPGLWVKGVWATGPSREPYVNRLQLNRRGAAEGFQV
ncbi:KLHDC4 [Symbiodinium natans]|uniref:KLHDC4 protein n=1 Tax=Symbiodinium natans TaxID=878477 RepID=A0A812SUP0_9DINO|nr:KLHDC4 [Symbiodinium natans]